MAEGLPLQEPQHPPFNIVQPRQLVRWLDINAQGGPLSRTRGLIRFSGGLLSISWDGRSSDKYGQFNFQATKNFSVLSLGNIADLIPVAQKPYVGMFIVNINLADHLLDLGVDNIPINDVVRYDLNPDAFTEGVGAPVYTNQPMKGQYFQIEFWSAGLQGGTHDTVLDLSVITTLLTSILGTQDYRYGSDFLIHSTPQFVQHFQNTNSNTQDLFGLPLTYLANTINGVNT